MFIDGLLRQNNLDALKDCILKSDIIYHKKHFFRMRYIITSDSHESPDDKYTISQVDKQNKGIRTDRGYEVALARAEAVKEKKLIKECKRSYGR